MLAYTVGPAEVRESPWVETRDGGLRVHGDLTIRGTTRPVVLEAEMPEVTGTPGRRRIGFEAETRIDEAPDPASRRREVHDRGRAALDRMRGPRLLGECGQHRVAAAGETGGRLAMDAADEGALPPTDHGVAQLAEGLGHCASLAKAESKAPAAGSA